MLETDVLPPKVVRDLESLLEMIRPLCAESGKVALYSKAVEMLSEAVDQQPTWGWRYVHNVLSGAVKPGHKFSQAVRKLQAELAGTPVPSEPQIILAEIMKIMGVTTITTDQFTQAMRVLGADVLE